MIKAVIKGTGRYVPERIVTNDDLTQLMDTSDEWIKQRTGIEQRHWVAEEGGVGPADLAVKAAEKAMKKAGWAPEDIDLIIFATLSPEYYFPSSGCLFQAKMGLDTTPTLDIRQQCTGFVYGMATADAYIRSGLAKRVLVCGSEVHSTGLDKTTRGRDVAVIFGDGAGVACVEAVETEDEGAGIITSVLHSHGAMARNLMVEAPTTLKSPIIDNDMIEAGKHFPIMDGSKIFKVAVRKLPEVAMESVKKAGISLDDIDLFIPHQANMRINQFVQKSMKLPEEKFFHNIQKYGNTTAASIPMALDEAMETGVVGKKGDTVMLFGLGAGLTWGSVIYRFV